MKTFFKMMTCLTMLLFSFGAQAQPPVLECPAGAFPGASGSFHAGQLPASCQPVTQAPIVVDQNTGEEISLADLIAEIGGRAFGKGQGQSPGNNGGGSIGTITTQGIWWDPCTAYYCLSRAGTWTCYPYPICF